MAETTSRPAVPIDERLREIAEASEPRGRLYRRQGREDWTPGSEPPPETQAQARARRQAEFGRLRDEGLSIAEASRRLGVPISSGYKYNAVYMRARRSGGPS